MADEAPKKSKRTSRTNRRPKANERDKAKRAEDRELKRKLNRAMSPPGVGKALPIEKVRERDRRRAAKCNSPEELLLAFKRGMPAPDIPRTPPEAVEKLKDPPKGFYYQGSRKKGDPPRDIWLEFFKVMIGRRWRKFEMKNHFREFIISMGYKPPQSHDMFEHLLAHARVQYRLDVLGLSSDDHRADAYNTMLDIIRSPEADNIDKIKAQQVINDVLGLSAKYKQGQELTEEEKAKLIAEMIRKEEAVAEKPVTADDLPDDEEADDEE